MRLKTEEDAWVIRPKLRLLNKKAGVDHKCPNRLRLPIDGLIRRSVGDYLNSPKIESLFKSKRVDLLDTREASIRSGKLSKNERRTKIKTDRALVQKVLDDTTKMILYKIMNQDILSSVNGCISTGKEANVYHGIAPEGNNLAIKIFKTVTSSFKRRDRYVRGDFRFKDSYVGPNKLKAVRVWAEKEMRNLKIISENKIRCPQVLLLKSHVLVMELIGNKNGWSAPTLKDYYPESIEEMRSLYYQAITIMYKMFHACSLIHGDYSEYNLLVYEKTLYVIDVSQSVRPDHPSAAEFLARDCFNITKFFRMHWNKFIPDAHRLFHFITTQPEDLIKLTSKDSETINTSDEALSSCLDKLIELIKDLNPEEYQACCEGEVAFCQNYTLCEVYKSHLDSAFHRQVFISYSGNPEFWLNQEHVVKLKYEAGVTIKVEEPNQSLKLLCGSMKNLHIPPVNDYPINDITDSAKGFPVNSSSIHINSDNLPDYLSDNSLIKSLSSSPDTSSESDFSIVSDSPTKRPGKKLAPKKFMDPVEKREHKKLVKEQKREKRMNKIPKKVKKRNKKKHLKK